MGLNPVKIYLDSCVVIYLIEEHTVFAPIIEAQLATQTNACLYVSSLTEMECLVIPLRNQNQPLVKKFREWFDKVVVLANEREIFQAAAQLRADYQPLKTPDAIHLATAINNGCDEFWTNDDRLAKVVPSLVRNILTI